MSLVDNILQDLDITLDDLTAILENPAFEKRGRVHDWRNYVPDFVMKSWDGLSFDVRALAYVMALRKAEAEEWD